MATTNIKKETRQQVLPPLRQREALASLIYLVLAEAEQIRWDNPTKKVHLENIIEYAFLEGVIGEDDKLPF